MALHDLTPQLRTRLSRMERAVGFFLMLAVGLLLFGFGYYLYNTAARKGWFLTKAPYFTFVSSADGLKVGDPVKLMGFDAGTITAVEPMPGYDFTYNVYLEFELKAPNYGYMWTEGSVAKITTADLLGKRSLEVTKGTNGYPTYIFNPMRDLTVTEAASLPGLEKWRLAQDVYDQAGHRLARTLWPLTNLPALAAADSTTIRVLDYLEERKRMTGIWNDREGRYDYYTATNKPYWLLSEESPAVAERLGNLVSEVERALPGVFSLTNQLSLVLSNTATLTSNLNVVAVGVQPTVRNLAAATANLDRPGGLGEWLVPTNINRQLDLTLSNASTVLSSADTNLNQLAEQLGRSLESLASITSNLNTQVQANTNILSQISQTIVDADTFVQGLKRHWLLRSAFKEKKTNAPPPRTEGPLRSPKDRTK